MVHAVIRPTTVREWTSAAAPCSTVVVVSYIGGRDFEHRWHWSIPIEFVGSPLLPARSPRLSLHLGDIVDRMESD
jgi:hypothetical protein